MHMQVAEANKKEMASYYISPYVYPQDRGNPRSREIEPMSNSQPYIITRRRVIWLTHSLPW